MLRTSRCRLYFLAVSLLVSLSGCQWLRDFSQRDIFHPPVGPAALSETPTLAEVIAQVNRDASQITSLKTTNASISGRMGLLPIPTLGANIAVDRPRRLRLIGETGVFGSQEVDLGSNDELFWFWVRRNEPPAILFARHDEFASSPLRKAWPVEPDWLIDALGMATLDPAGQHSPPQKVGRGRIEIASQQQSATGWLRKVTRIDQHRGRIVEQHLYDESNQLLASALTRDFQTDPVTQLTVPKQLELTWPTMQLTLRINLGNVQVNQLETNPGLFDLPEIPGYQPVNLRDFSPIPSAGGTAGDPASPVPAAAARRGETVTTINRGQAESTAARKPWSLW